MKAFFILSKSLIDAQVIGISNGVMSLEICEKQEADKVISKYHYSKKATKNSFLSIRVNDGQGYMQLGYGIRPAIKSSICEDITKGNYAEFDRMWLSDDLPKNSESMAIGLLIKLLRRIKPELKYLITYADESAGNQGTIYKATNAFRLGSIPCDFYILENGERVHPVSMYHRHGSRSKATLEAIYPNIRHIKGEYRQFRFLYILDRKIKRNFTKNLRGNYG